MLKPEVRGQRSEVRRQPARRSFSEGGTTGPPSPERFGGQAPDDRQQTPNAGHRTTFDAGCFKSEIKNRKSEMRSTGQAMVEFIVRLVIVLVLLVGLIQVGQLTHARTRTMIAARAAAGQLAMAPTVPVSEVAPLIYNWVPGPDLRRHTHDDLALVTSNAATLPGELVGQAHLEQVPDAPVNALATLRDSPNPAGAFFLVKGKASESVPILPIIRRLVYAHSTLEVKSDAWLVWAEGIY